MRVLSLGAGVQSSTIALMIHKGDMPPIREAIFADTGAESNTTLRWLDWLEPQVRSSFPITRVQAKRGLPENLEDAIVGRTSRADTPPFFTTGGGMIRRQCTYTFKIAPIRRRLQAIRNRERVEMLIGISAEESRRIKPSDVKYIQNIYPLVEQNLTRRDCLKWMILHDYPWPPRSSCWCCPFRRNDEWGLLKQNDPASFNKAVRLDKLIREGLPGFREMPYFHPSLRPLEEVDFHADTVQLELGLSCDGYCGW